MKAANRLRSLPGHNADAAIVALHWSQSGNLIGSADDSGHILIRKIQIPSPKSPDLLIWKASDFHVNDGVLQLLISPDDRFLLASSSSSVQLFDVKNKNVCRSHKLTLQRQARWAQHPSNSDRVIRICSDRVHVFEWEELRLLQPVDGLHFSREHETEGTKLSETELVQKVFRDISFRSLAAPSKDFPDSMPEVTSIIQTRDKHVIIFETILPHVPGHGRHRRKRLELFRTAALDEYDSIHRRRGFSASSESSKDSETSIALEDLSTVSQSVFKLVGTYQNEIVFFNDQHWLCSWEIDTKPHTHRKHFALPQDWLKDETLRLTSMKSKWNIVVSSEWGGGYHQGWDQTLKNDKIRLRAAISALLFLNWNGGSGVYLAGALFSIGFFFFIDASTYSHSHLNAGSEVHIKFVDWIPGICSALGMLVINSIEKTRLSADSYSYSGTGVAWKARLVLFLGFALMAGGLAGSVAVLVLKYVVPEYGFPALYFGIANVLANGLIMLSSVVLWVSQNMEDDYTYNLAL
ncbi:MAG: hypothetical protein LQ344_001682 [Seirophora lacunosa]|nr:MAG: hypothetical protein LQ344_001682 [Seirophora lacunosa]